MGSWLFDPSWSVWFDSHLNSDSFFVVRGGLTYHLESGPRVTAGYAHLLLNDVEGNLGRNELRPWAQAVLPMSLGDDWTFSQRIRADLRFRERLEESGFGFTFRLRLQPVLTYYLPETRWGRPLVQIYDEVLVNLAGDAGPNFLDQNRVALLVGVKKGSMTVRTGYIHRVLPDSSGTRRTHEHNAIVWLNYTWR